MWQDQDNHGSSSANHDNRDHVSITESPLNLSEIVNLVRDGGAGAMATFSGTTRNYFIVEGITKKVTLLSYEAYVPMAIKELHNCISQARKLYPSIISAVIQHRIGDVAIGQESVVIAVSAPHRKDALHATEYLIDELKATVPIWKKEMYEDGSTWKENGERNIMGGGSM
ncbi:molybdopterin synthase [Synchytrium endobioticum]|uniref:Molybdopterin synthase n=2 Tax=Synchytrium endobioticum TaxID=286115 RepID=A0A507CMC2_9FUNG|nr:molybdopterin synthase [Synchytrium endobioticum]